MQALGRLTGLVVVAAVAAAPTAVPQEPDGTGDLVRVRTVNPALRAIVDRGVLLSPTLRRLVAAIQRSDLIVHVERHNRFSKGKVGSIQLVGVRGGQRYVRIELDSVLSRNELIVALAHELQHATELAEAAHVADPRILRELYCAIGESRAFGYDTAAAQFVSRQVAAEVSASPDR